MELQKAAVFHNGNCPWDYSVEFLYNLIHLMRFGIGFVAYQTQPPGRPPALLESTLRTPISHLAVRCCGVS